MNEEKTAAYERLTPQRKQLVDAVLKNLENGTGLWEQGWAGGDAPVSAITGKQYNGVNRLREWTTERWWNGQARQNRVQNSPRYSTGLTCSAARKRSKLIGWVGI